MDIKSILGLVANPTVLAAAGGWLGYKYGKKASISNKYVAGGVGVGAGYLLGRTLQSFAQQPQQSPMQQLPAAQQQDQSLDDFLLTEPGQAVAALPPASPMAAFEQAIQEVNESQGEGSYGKSSYNRSGIDAAMGEAEAMLRDEGSN